MQEEVSGTLATSNDQTVICIQGTIAKGGRMGQNGEGYRDDGACYTLNTIDRHAVASMQDSGGPAIGGNTKSVIRRLTPRECERLQGMPDNWTRVPYRGKTADRCPDGPRYKAIGNSMAVPVMRFIGERIQMVEESGVA